MNNTHSHTHSHSPFRGLRSALAALTLLIGISLPSFAGILTLGNYLDPSPAPGQHILNGYVAGTLSGFGAQYDGATLLMCLDYDHNTANGASLEGTIVAPTTLDQMIQAYIFLGRSGYMNDPLNPNVDQTAYAIWDAKAGVPVPDVYGSASLEAFYRSLFFEGDVAAHIAQVQAYTAIFQPGNYYGKAPDQAFVFLRTYSGEFPQTGTPEPATWGMGALSVGLIGLRWVRVRKATAAPATAATTTGA